MPASTSEPPCYDLEGRTSNGESAQPSPAIGTHARASADKGQAAHLISSYEGQPKTAGRWTGENRGLSGDEEAGGLRRSVETAQRALAMSGPSPARDYQRELELARTRRQDFWMQTCVEPASMRMHSEQLRELYMKHGCRFAAPTREQAQEILDALDQALPRWDQDRPELFHQTLEINFPELRRHAG